MTYNPDEPTPLPPDEWAEEPLTDVVTAYTGLSVQERAARLGNPPNTAWNAHPLEQVLTRIAVALEKLSSAPTSPSQPPGPPMASNGPPPRSAGNGDEQVKRGKKIYAICTEQGANIQETGEHVVGHKLNFNSQKWNEADQLAVLAALKEWGWDNR